MKDYDQIVAGLKTGTRDGYLFAATLPLLNMSFKLLMRKQKGPKPFTTVDFATNAKLINQVILDMTKYYDRNIYNKTIVTNLGIVARFMIDAAREVTMPSLQKDFVYLANQLNCLKVAIQNRQ